MKIKYFKHICKTLPFLTVIAFLVSCASEKDFSSDYGTAGAPSKITGASLHSMECSFIKTGIDLSFGQIGCAVIDSSGTKISIDPSESLAQIATKDERWIDASITYVGEESQHSFILDDKSQIIDLKENAVFVKYEATVDGEEIRLGASVNAALSTNSTRDLNLFVSASADPKNSVCSQDYPCSKIKKALDQIPDNVLHNMSIKIANTAIYKESLLKLTANLANSKKISISGYDSKFEKPEQVTLNPLAEASSGMDLSVDSKDQGVTLDHIKISGFSDGLKVSQSRVQLSDVEINAHSNGIFLLDSKLSVQGPITILNTQPASSDGNTFGIQAESSEITLESDALLSVSGYEKNISLVSSQLNDQPSDDAKLIKLKDSKISSLYLNKTSSLKLSFTSLDITDCLGECLFITDSKFSFTPYLYASKPINFVLKNPNKNADTNGVRQFLITSSHSENFIDLNSAASSEICIRRGQDQDQSLDELAFFMGHSTTSTLLLSEQTVLCEEIYHNNILGVSEFFINNTSCRVQSESVQDCVGI